MPDFSAESPPADQPVPGVRRRPRLGLGSRVTLALLLVAVLVSAGTMAVMVQVARQQSLEDLRQRLGDIVGVAAVGFDARLQDRVSPDAGMDSQAYQDLVAALRRIRDRTSDLYFVYTMRLGPEGDIRFVGDAEENPDDVAPLGSAYSDASALLRAKFATMDGPVVEPDLYTDQWGTWLSGYAPLVTADGERVGVLGADISAATVQALERRLWVLGLVVFGGTLPLVLGLGVLLGRALTRPLAVLTRGAERISAGDLSVRLGLSSGDEIGTLAQAFDTMAERLAQSHRDLAESARQYRDIFDNAVEGIFRSTPEGRLLTANRAMLDLLGFPDLASAQAGITTLGESVYACPHDRERLLEEVRRHGRVDSFEAAFHRADGGAFCAEISLRAIERDGQTVLEGMILDITERRRRQDAEREREAARAASEAKSGFLANMSHEIRTPLNAIMGLTDLVLRTELTERQRDFLSKVKVSSASLLAVINDILDFSKIEAGRLDLEETGFSLDEVLANLTEMFAYRAHERDIELIVSADPDVPRALIGDPVRLGQILINLTSNALKFTEQGEVAVTVSLAARGAGAEASSGDDLVALRFDVRDTGPGIPEDRQEAIFQSFSQADGSITRRHGGTGLGLAICRQLAGLMGGAVTLRSTPGAGSTFTATAVFRRQPASAERRPITPATLRGLSVLIADDNATARQILVDQIESFGMRVVAVASGSEALEALAAPGASFDLVLMDWKMPGLNGLEAARHIRSDLNLAHTPLICMVSAYAREDLMQQGDRTILDAFLHKPVNQSFLFDTIVSLFGHPEASVSGAILGGGLASGGEGAAPPDLSGRRVLLVEDIDMNRLVAMEWLASAGLAVDTADHGQQALDLVDPARHAAVLMDLQMPVLDGLEATRRIRARPGHADLPIIAMTAHALATDIDRCLAAGMNDYVAKPIDPGHLFSVLARWIPPADTASASERAGVTTAEAQGGLPPDLGLDLPGIDRALGLARANGNAALYRRMLHTFRDSWGDVPQCVVADIAAGRAAEARRRVHSAKGLAGNIGATALFEAGAKAEAMIADGAFDPEGPVWQAFCAAMAEVQAGLARLPDPAVATGETGAGEREAEAPQDISDRLDQVITLLDDDLGRAREALGALRPGLARLVGVARVDTVQSLVDDFDIEAAIAALEDMRKDILHHDD